MLIRYYVMERDQCYDDAKMIQAYTITDFGEYMKMLSYTSHIKLKDSIVYDILFYEFEPKEVDAQMDCINIYLVEP